MTNKLKHRIDCLQCKAKKLFRKQGSDFPFKEKELKRRDRLPVMESQNIVKQWLDFPFDKRNETTDRLLPMQGQKGLRTADGFPI